MPEPRKERREGPSRVPGGSGIGSETGRDRLGASGSKRHSIGVESAGGMASGGKLRDRPGRRYDSS